MSRFYTTIKVHKNPYTFRPIVATCGTALYILSKWLDNKLQQLKPYISMFVKDGDDFWDKLKDFRPLPSNARVFTADANSMYTNIDTEHALIILRKFLEELAAEGKLPLDFVIEMIVEAAKLVMRWNIFVYGDCYFKQLIGTAMGTPAAVIWAMIYFYWHKKTQIDTQIQNNDTIFIARFVDDVFGITLVGGADGLSEDGWSEFRNEIDGFGILTWDVEDPSKSTDFLDLMIKIKDGVFITQTYQKAINLYQYLTPDSAHPSWMIKAMIYGLLGNMSIKIQTTKTIGK